MKKIIFIVLSLILLCGCGDKTVTPVTRQISFTANITYYNEQFVCETNVDKDGVTQMTVVSPETLKGLSFTVNESGITAEFLGLKYTPKTENMPYSIVTYTVYELLNAAHNRKLELNEKNCILSGKLGERPFTLTVSPAGMLLKAQIPDDSFTVEFFDMTVH